MDLGAFIASGGITGAVVAVAYIGYKCCYKKKFHSKCCNAEMIVDIEAPEMVGCKPPSVFDEPIPQNTPQIQGKITQDPPKIILE